MVRFDDVCPTMNWAVWDDVEKVMSEHGIRPLLAVVPDNQDSSLVVGPARDDFWDRVRAWQAQGWTIGLHGFQHRYVSADRGLVGFEPKSEFAGVDRETQSTKLERAVAIFAAEGVRPSCWVAPGHTFDETTLALLTDLGINVVSDGMGLRPGVDHRGIVWVPQQLWRFRSRLVGTWTVCFHVNSWDQGDVATFTRDVHRWRRSVVPFDQAVTDGRRRQFGRRDVWVDRALRAQLRLRARVSHVARARRGRSGATGEA